MICRLIDRLRTIAYWLPVLWADRWWDVTFMWRIWEHKLRRDAEMYDRYGCHVGSKRDARQMRYAAGLLKRLADDEYFVNASLRVRKFKRVHAGEFSWMQQRQDIEALFTELRRHSARWWD